MKPKFLGGDEPDVAGKDRRVALAKWLASPENPYFATNLANIVWAHFFGKGSSTRWTTSASATRPSNPELLDELGQEVHRVQVRLQEAGPRHLHVADLPALDAGERSRTRATRGTSPAADPPHPGRVMLDCISAGDRDEEQVPGPAAGRAGRADRRRRRQHLLPHDCRISPSRCTCSTAARPTKRSKGGIVKTLLKTKKPEEVVEELYLRVPRSQTKREGIGKDQRIPPRRQARGHTRTISSGPSSTPRNSFSISLIACEVATFEFRASVLECRQGALPLWFLCRLWRRSGVKKKSPSRTTSPSPPSKTTAASTTFPDKKKGDLDLSSYNGALKGGGSGPGGHIRQSRQQQTLQVHNPCRGTDDAAEQTAASRQGKLEVFRSGLRAVSSKIPAAKRSRASKPAVDLP